MKQCQECQKGVWGLVGLCWVRKLRNFVCRIGDSICTDLSYSAWGRCVQISQSSRPGVSFLKTRSQIAVTSPMLSM
jgi:hypothetical protein